MRRKPVPVVIDEDVSVDDAMEEAYEAHMQEVYDILMEAYDKVGVKTQDFMAELAGIDDWDAIEEDNDD